MYHSIIVTELVETCRIETFDATCRTGQIIVVTAAQLGRMRVGRCIKVDEFIGCTNDVLSLVDERCSGKQHCEFMVGDLDSANKGCSSSLRIYLEVEYSCVKGMSYVNCTFEVSNKLL